MREFAPHLSVGAVKRPQNVRESVAVGMREHVLKVMDRQREQGRDRLAIPAAQIRAVKPLVIDQIEVGAGEAVIQENKDGIDRSNLRAFDTANLVAF